MLHRAFTPARPLSPHAGQPVIEARAGSLTVRLARTPAEVAAAQALRHAIFYGEMGARPSSTVMQHSALAGRQLDIDSYDALCDHLLVLDHGDTAPRVVGTYRLLRQSVADANGGFYSANEFNLDNLLQTANGHGELLELGRSCVAPAYRTAATISLLWRGIAAYLDHYGISHMFGCASFHGTCPDRHAAELSYLHHRHLAPMALRGTAHVPVPLERLSPGSYDVKAAQRALPPLLKGYLRVGAMIGDGAYIDTQFNTVDVFVVMPVGGITRRYLDRFAATAPLS